MVYFRVTTYHDPSGLPVEERTPNGTYYYLFDGPGNVAMLVDPPSGAPVAITSPCPTLNQSGDQWQASNSHALDEELYQAFGAWAALTDQGTGNIFLRGRYKGASGTGWTQLALAGLGANVRYLSDEEGGDSSGGLNTPGTLPGAGGGYDPSLSGGYDGGNGIPPISGGSEGRPSERLIGDQPVRPTDLGGYGSQSDLGRALNRGSMEDPTVAAQRGSQVTAGQIQSLGNPPGSVTAGTIRSWRDFYQGISNWDPQNPTAPGRAAYVNAILQNLGGS